MRGLSESSSSPSIMSSIAPIIFQSYAFHPYHPFVQKRQIARTRRSGSLAYPARDHTRARCR